MQTNPESAAVEAVAVAVIGELNGSKVIIMRSYDEIGELPKGTKLYPQSALDALRGEVEACRRLLSEKVTAETMLRELHITPAGLSAQVEGGMAGILMQSIVDQFREIGGPNFFEMKFIADEQQYVLTVQRSAGLTPADKMKAAEHRADAAERRVAECLKFIDGIREELHNRRVADWYPEAAHNAAEQMSEDMRLIGNACADFDPDTLRQEKPE